MEAVVITYQRAYHEICKIMISEDTRYIDR